MIINPSYETIGSIFEKNILLEVPKYQRYAKNYQERNQMQKMRRSHRKQNCPWFQVLQLRLLRRGWRPRLSSQMRKSWELGRTVRSGEGGGQRCVDLILGELGNWGDRMSLKIQLFENQRIRTAWDEEKEEWYFSIVDVVGVLTDSVDPTAYWRKLKQRLKAEGNETVTNWCCWQSDIYPRFDK